MGGLPATSTLLILAGIVLAMFYNADGEHQLLFNQRQKVNHSRMERSVTSSPIDVMAQNILEWIQGIYNRQQGARKIRQQSDANAYLPPYSTQRPPEKPRPFRPSSTGEPPFVGSSPGGYPSGSPSSPGTRPTYIPPVNQGSSTASSPNYGTPTSYNPRPPVGTYSPGSTPLFPPLDTSSTVYLPPGKTSPRPSPSGPPLTGFPTAFPSPSGFTPGAGYPSQPSPTPGFPTPTGGGGSSGAGYPSQTPGSPTPPFPTPTGGGGSSGGAYPSPTPGGPTPGFPTPNRPGVPSGPGGSGAPSGPGDSGAPSGPGGSGAPSGPGGSGIPSGPGVPSAPGGSGGPNSIDTGSGTPNSQAGGTGEGDADASAGTDDDLNHPPHIHNIDVECSKTMMTINIEFNRAFDGLIYSKGFYMNPECRYVEQSSGQTQYSFTVNLDSCGTQFINEFEGEAGQAYLENVLVLQNEPGIQEVWDTVRRVRCLWEGNINKALSISLSVDMLNQEIVTFSGDTASAKLDIQVGKGPFAPAADGLVKIGETMTLVISVEGDPGFDLQPRDCIARDETSTNQVQLTDERGCILKPKLFGAFQKTRETGNTGASIIAYAFFQAFKFPDVMDLFIECNVELCKTDCDGCPDENQQIDPGRRRRSIMYIPKSNSTSYIGRSDSIRVKRGFRVVMLDDLSTASGKILEKLEETAIKEIKSSQNICMSNSGFYGAFSLIIGTLFVSTISAMVLYFKLHRIYRVKFDHS